MSKRDEIVLRSGIVYLVVALLAITVLVRILLLQFVQKEKWSAMGEAFIFRKDVVQANRGDILTDDGRILASSVPYYSIYMDTRSTGMADTVWRNGINGLSSGLASIFGDRSAAAWKSELSSARNKGNRYLLIRRHVSHSNLKRLRQLPIFRRGQYQGGLLVIPENRRIYPNMELAVRTIGYITEDAGGNVVGLEGAFDKELAGSNGTMMMQRLTGGDWLPVDDGSTIVTRDGNDIITTIDVDLQDVAHSALLGQLRKQNAHHGTAVLMEVSTGDIKAIANLEIGSDGRYHETYNYAVGESTEPGSTFKLPAIMAALEEGKFDLDDVVDTGNGTIRFYNKIIRDTRQEGYGKLTVQEVFEKSSNVGTAKIVFETFKDKPKVFVDRLYAMKLNEKLGLQIRGEGAPLIRYPGDKLWSGLSLPMMSHGYEVQMTPLQILTFYNAVANNGKMVRPRFVTAVSYHGKIIREFPSEVISPSISSRSTIAKARVMLEGVVEHGTATNLRNANYKIAGKTGTAQIANQKYGYRQGNSVSYQASFVGYFPAGNPLYSCIVVVNAPSNSVYYGNLVAGPVFKEIADRVYAKYFFRFHEDKPEEERSRDLIASVPELGGGHRDDVVRVTRELDLTHNKIPGTGWVSLSRQNDTIRFKPFKAEEGVVPDVRGMMLRDAVYLLENSGWYVRYTGSGRVKRQTPAHGGKLKEGSTIFIELEL
jgi:cell division protein FtsI (penicillin-binding protein 3)